MPQPPRYRLRVDRKLRVWAPNATRVELVLANAERLEMQRCERGHFELSTAQLPPGARYAFSLDGSDPLPDPRSRHQPEGVHGSSELVDPDEFAWTDSAFQPVTLADAVIYELHVGAFTEAGTFVAAIEHLDHLVELGITHVEVMPVAAFSGSRGWGYDGVYPFAVQADYGGPLGLMQFVDACHARGIAVLLDVVYNHLGPSGNYAGRYGPYFTGRYTTPWGEAVNFDDAGSDEVRRFICDNARYWLEQLHVDGLRIDAVHEIFDRSATHVLEALAREVEALSRRLEKPLVLIAESSLNDPKLIRPRSKFGYGLHAQWNDEFHHALRTVLTGERQGYYEDYGALWQLARAIGEGYVHQGEFSKHRGHSHGARPTAVELAQFVVFFQNHDQVGNRARGDRPSSLVGTRKLKQASALVLLGPSVPLLFMGEEWGTRTPFPYFTDHSEPELGEAVRRGRAREFAAFGWRPDEIPDPQAASTFRSAKLNWSELEQSEHREMLAWYRTLIELRRETRESRGGAPRDVAVRFEEEERWLATRVGELAVLCNFAERERPIDTKALFGRQHSLAEGRCRLATDETTFGADGHVQLPPSGVVVWSSGRKETRS